MNQSAYVADADVLVVVPARMASVRFPGKPMAMIDGVPMVEHTRRAAGATGYPVVVAADDVSVVDAVTSCGGRAVMTSAGCPDGTSRCIEAVARLGAKPRVVVNLQADEPMMPPGLIRLVATAALAGDADVVTALYPIADAAAVFDPNVVKAVCDNRGYAMYFSRSPIPYVRDAAPPRWLGCQRFLGHIGIYAFSMPALDAIGVSHKKLEGLPSQAECLEQLAWLEAGLSIKCEMWPEPTVGVDTPADLETVKHLMNG